MKERGICVAVPIVCVSPIKSCAEGVTDFNYDWGYVKPNVKDAKRTSFWLLRCTTASIFWWKHISAGVETTMRVSTRHFGR